VQEALQNVIKHGGVMEAEVRVGLQPTIGERQPA
jgi:signal transduction histidine kinase